MRIKTFLFSMLILLLYLYPQKVTSSQPNVNLSAEAITRLNPNLRIIQALDISAAISSTSCPISQKKLLAILFIESSLRLKVVNENTKDYGIAQININSIKRFKLDKQRLLNSYSYSVQAACKILKHHKDIVGHYPEWIGSYRAGTNFKSIRTRQNAKNYVKLINNTVAKLDE